MLKRLAVSLVAITATLPALTAELAGVNVPDSVTVSGSTLVLNGVGLRKKAIFKVYVGALYVASRSNDPAAILKADSARRMEMHFLRSVGREKIAEAWREGFANNSSSELAALQQRLDTFVGYFSDVAEGDVIAMTYAPGTGVTVEVRGIKAGTVAGKDFADAVLRCWVGDTPPSAELKTGILGK